MIIILTMRGKFIVLYGINNLGKSTQAHLLVEHLINQGTPATYIKYPLYDLAPTGPLLNEYLRGGNPHGLSSREAQLLYTLNRTQFEPELRKLLEAGTTVIAEDYTGTGIAWGMGGGVPKDFLTAINSHLLKEDIAFLFDGDRFESGIEASHKHEQDNSLTEAVRKAHQELGDEQGWIHINANQSIEEIQKQIISYLI